MAWIESHQSLARHPKTIRAARLLDISTVQLIGHLHLLWWWALDYAEPETGSLAKYDDLDIALAAEWDGDPERFVTALCDCGPGNSAGFLESDDNGRLVIHDWHHYGGKLTRRKQANAERMRNARAAHVLRTSDARAAHVSSDKQTVKDITTVISSEPEKSGRTFPVYAHDGPEYQTAIRLRDHITANNPKAKVPTEAQLQKWAHVVSLMQRRDNRRLEDIHAVLDWSQSDPFWMTNVLSMDALRRGFDRLYLAMTKPSHAQRPGANGSQTSPAYYQPFPDITTKGTRE